MIGAAYYNEIDPFAAQWLRNLIAKNLIARGDVDGNPKNNLPTNLQTLCMSCHSFWHAMLRRTGRAPKVRMPFYSGAVPERQSVLL